MLHKQKLKNINKKEEHAIKDISRKQHERYEINKIEKDTIELSFIKKTEDEVRECKNELIKSKQLE